MTSGRQGYREQSSFRQGTGENRGGWEWGEGIVHVWDQDVMEAADSSRLGLKVCEGAVAGLPIGLYEAVDVEGIYVVEEGAVL